MIPVVLKRTASEDAPGNPGFRHIPEMVRIVQIFVAECMGRFEKLVIHPSLFSNDILQRAIPVLLVNNLVALIFQQIPQFRAAKDVRSHDRHYLKFAPHNMRDDIFN